MPTQIHENRAQKRLRNNEPAPAMGANRRCTPLVATIAAACGFDAVRIVPAGRADMKRRREPRIG